MVSSAFYKYTLLCLLGAAAVLADGVGDAVQKDAADDDCQNRDEWVCHYFQYHSFLSQHNL